MTSAILDGFAPGDPRAGNLGYWSHVAASAAPEAIAMIDLSGARPRELRYGAFEEPLDRLAALVAAHGLKPGDRLATAVGNRYEFVDVYTLEVEHLLLRHPAVADVLVVAVLHAIKGEAPVAMVVLSTSALARKPKTSRPSKGCNPSAARSRATRDRSRGGRRRWGVGSGNCFNRN